MNRTPTFRTTALIALPFLLLPAGIWLANTAAQLWYIEAAPFQPWQGVRWLLRVVYVGGAILGWRTRCPVWFYPWLGFAVYETVATLMQFALEPLARLWMAVLGDGPNVILGQFLYMMAISMSPSIAALLWFRRQPHQMPLMIFTAFPPAALTIPLILSAVTVEDVGGMPRGMMQLAMEGMSPVATFLAAVCAAIFAILFWRPPLTFFRGRANMAQLAVLIGGVPLCHFLYLTFLIIYSFGEQLDFTGDLRIFLISAGLGWLILSVPLLLPPLLKLPARLLNSSPETLLRSAVGMNC